MKHGRLIAGLLVGLGLGLVSARQTAEGQERVPLTTRNNAIVIMDVFSGDSWSPTIEENGPSQFDPQVRDDRERQELEGAVQNQVLLPRLLAHGWAVTYTPQVVKVGKETRVLFVLGK